jgi:predicted nucleic acid-binding protein
MALVVDASVAFKWFVPEPASDRALLLLDLNDALIAPELILVEVINAMWARLRGRENFATVVGDATRSLPRILESTVPAAPLMARALAMTIELNHPLYDCIYLALAEREAAFLVTADDSFRRKVTDSSLSGLAISVGEALA